MKRLISILLFCLSLGLASCGGGSSAASPSSPVSNPSPTSQSVALEVLNPPSSGTYASAIESDLMSNTIVTGANFFVKWAAVDQGNSQYDFSTVDSEIQSWIAAGKKINLIVWAVSDGAVNDSTPAYVLTNLGSANTTTCDGEVTPNYFSAAFQTPYQAFMQALVQHYGSNSSVGYIRFGLGRGGETYPSFGFTSDATCSAAFANWGWTTSSWTNYLTSMLDYEATLQSPKQLMVGINTVNGDIGIPDAVAADAVSHKIGFGSQGLQASDTSNYSAGKPCTADWCALFNTYQGQVPLELQTLTQSDPSGAGMTGSLVDLLPFAVQRHATILELYYEDWLTAFDPSYPGYTASYATALQSAAQGQ